MSNSIKHKIELLIVALTILFLAGCDNVTKEPDADAKVIRPAKIYTVSEQSQLNYLSLPAVIEAKDSIALAFEISGKIQKVYVESGQDVKKGDMIAKLDQTSLKNDLAAIKANYDNVRVRFNRVKKLIKNNTISRSMFEQTESEYKIAQANYNNAKQRLADSVIYSPYTGPVSRVHVDNFETIVPDQAIVTIQQDGASLAVASIPSSIIANSKKIKPTSIKVLLDSAPSLQMEGVVESFETMTESSSQSFPVKIQFTPPENLTVLPGMTATIEISYQDSDKATVQLSAKLEKLMCG